MSSTPGPFEQILSGLGKLALLEEGGVAAATFATAFANFAKAPSAFSLVTQGQLALSTIAAAQPALLQSELVPVSSLLAQAAAAAEAEAVALQAKLSAPPAATPAAAA
jgi:hypothetical protein